MNKFTKHTMMVALVGAIVVVVLALLAKPVNQRTLAMASITLNLMDAYLPYSEIVSVYGHYSPEADEAAETAFRRIEAVSGGGEVGLSYVMLINIAAVSGKEDIAQLLQKGFRSLGNQEVWRLLGATKRHWDETENERQNALIAELNEARGQKDLNIPATPLAHLEPGMREAFQACLDLLENRFLGQKINLYLDLYLDRKDCPSLTGGQEA